MEDRAVVEQAIVDNSWYRGTIVSSVASHKKGCLKHARPEGGGEGGFWSVMLPVSDFPYNSREGRSMNSHAREIVGRGVSGSERYLVMRRLRSASFGGGHRSRWQGRMRCARLQARTPNSSLPSCQNQVPDSARVFTYGSWAHHVE